METIGNLVEYNPYNMSLSKQDKVAKKRTIEIHNNMVDGKLFETDRLVLRELRKEDKYDIHDALRKEGVVEFLKFKKYQKVKNAIKYLKPMLKRYADGWGDYPTDYGIVDKETGKVVGVIGISLDSGTGYGSVEFDYWLNSSAWKKGYMTETLIGASDFIEKNGLARRIGLSHGTHNPESGRAARRAGFEFWGKNKGSHSNPRWGVEDEYFLVKILNNANCYVEMEPKSEIELIKDERMLLNNTAAQMAYDIEIGFDDGLGSYEARSRLARQALAACDVRAEQIEKGIGEPVYI